MSRLSYNEFGLTQSYLDFIRGELKTLDLALSTYGDLESWKRLLSSAPGAGPLSKTLDPALNFIAPNAGFWLSLDHKHEPIACVGGRLLETTNFVEEFVTTYLLFGDRKPRLSGEPYEFVKDPPDISGRVVYSGGSWVHPDWRGRDLAAVTSRLVRVIGLRHLRTDYHAGFVQATADRKSWSKHTLGWPKRQLLTTGHHPGRDDFVTDILLVWATKADILKLCKERRSLGRVDKGRLKRTA